MSGPGLPPGFEPCGRRIGDYQLGQMLGGGGMGSVYLARQISTNRLVSVKLLRSELSANPSYLKRFFHEVRLLAKIDNPGIVQAYEAGVDGGIAFFAMEYVNGSDLKTILAVRKRMPELEVLRAASAIANTMAYAWNKFQLIHRDVKPANIMRTSDGAYRLLDLGISKLAGSGAETTALTSEQMMSGSPTYMSPEQADGNRPVDCRSDIYSLGVTMYHLLAGEAPYVSGNPVEVLMMHRSAPVPDLRDVCPDVTPNTAALIENMMAKDPDHRPDSWESIARMTESLALSFQTIPRLPLCAMPTKTVDGTFRLRIILFVLLCILLVLLAILICMVPSGANTKGRDLPRSFSPVTVRMDDELDALRKSELQTLLRLSAAHEFKGDYMTAAKLWKNYSPPKELVHDEALKKQVADHLAYLEDRIKEAKDDAGE